MPKIQYADNIPDQIKELVSRNLDKTKWIIPDWCQRFYVRWVSNESDAIMRCSLEENYRQAYLYIYPGLLDFPPEEQFEMFIHEMVHCYTVPFKTVCLEAFDDLEIDESIKNILERRINAVMEQTTQDFAFSIFQKLNS